MDTKRLLSVPVFYGNCPSTTIDRTFFPEATPGSNSTGTCATGYEENPNGPPALFCFANGTWAEDYSNPCKLSTIARMKWLVC